MPPQTSEVPHFHQKARQFFFVLAGSLTLLIDGKLYVLGSEEGLEIPPNITHRVSNEGGTDALFLVISVPPSHGDRVPVAESAA